MGYSAPELARANIRRRGNFCLEHPDITKAISPKKIKNSMVAGGSLQATECQGGNEQI
jgi:hypothetical protein